MMTIQQEKTVGGLENNIEKDPEGKFESQKGTPNRLLNVLSGFQNQVDYQVDRYQIESENRKFAQVQPKTMPS